MNQARDDTISTPTDLAELATIARSQALWAAVAAAAMLYFGFTMNFAEEAGAQVIGYTLQGGGVAMAVSAILLVTGWPFSLLFDGIATMLIGVGFTIGGALWLVAIGTVDMQGILDIVFGYVFFTSGKRSFTDYTRINPLFVDESAGSSVAQSPRLGDPTAPEAHASQPGSLATKLLDRSEEEEPPRNEDVPIAPPPEGFLSSFADDDSDAEDSTR